MERTLQTSKELLAYFMKHQKGVPPLVADKQLPSTLAEMREKNSQARHLSTPPPFAVAAILEALRQSEIYGPLTKLMAGEADTFCAKHAALYGATVLTSDSDLLICDLGQKSSVVFLSDMQLDSGGKAVKFKALEYQAYEIWQRLSIDPVEGVTTFAFELYRDPYQSLEKLVDKSKQKGAATRRQDEYKSFAKPYNLSGVTLEAVDGVLFDPRVSEIALGWSDPPAVVHGGTAYHSSGMGISMYLPLLLDSPSLTSAWEPSRSIRELAYSFVCQTTGRVIPSAAEYRRLQSLSKGVAIDLVEASELENRTIALRDMISTIMDNTKHIQETDVAWGIVLSIYLDIAMSKSQGKSKGLSIEILHQEATGTLDECSWEYLHFAAQIQGAFYSLRMLQQVLSFFSFHSGRDMPSYVSQLQSHLATIPALARFPSLKNLKAHLISFRQTGGWGFLTKIFQMPEVTAAHVLNIGVGRKKRKRDRKAKNQGTSTVIQSSSSNPFDVLGAQ